VPVVVGATGVVIERLMLSKLYKLDHLYGLLLTFGLALIIQGLFRNEFGSSGQPYQIPDSCRAASTWASCSCPNTAAGSSSPRSRCAWPPGT
jgi:branched-chain amino acid transport system permease protein